MTTMACARCMMYAVAAGVNATLLVLAMVAVAVAQGQEPLRPGTYEQTIEHGGYNRAYRLHIPPQYNATRVLPLVFVLHGGAGTGAQIERYSGFSRVADEKGFVIAYPDGVNRGWNDGRESERVSTRSGHVDDVGLIGSLIDHLARRMRIDPLRVYATGISNGGFLSHRVGMELSDRVAAIAPIAGTLGENLVPRFEPKHPVAVLHIHGTQDRFVPYEGGEVVARGGTSISAPRIAEMWAKANGCATPARTEQLPDRDPNDGTRIRADSYASCRLGATVTLLTIVGGGHTWPGRPARLLGATTRDIDGAHAVWEFFEQHPKQRP
jgi:polyhydroxybutyrate depolymerase